MLNEFKKTLLSKEDPNDYLEDPLNIVIEQKDETVNSWRLKVRTNNVYLIGAHEVYIRASLQSLNRGESGTGVTMTTRSSPPFNIVVYDPCQPYSCENVLYAPPVGDAPDNIEVVFF